MRADSLKPFWGSSLRANLVVRTNSSSTTVGSTYSAGLRALAFGNRDSVMKKNWSLGRAVIEAGANLKLFGQGAATGMGLEWMTKAASAPSFGSKDAGSAEFIPEASFRGASAEVFSDLMAQVATPGSVVVVDLNVIDRKLQPAFITALMARSKPLNWNLVIASLADVQSPRLQLFAASGPDFPSGAATSGSTRRRALVQNTDLTATILDYVGADIPPLVKGSPLQAKGRVNIVTLASDARRAAVILPAQPIFWTALSAAFILVMLGGVWSLNRRTHPQLGDSWKKPNGLLHFWRFFGTVVALVLPVGYYMNLAPWWNLGPPATDTAVPSLAWVGGLLPLALAFLVGLLFELLGLASLFGPLPLIGVSSLVIGLIDPLFGSPMMLDSPIGAQSTVGGRFFGIDNMMFAVFATGALISAALLFSLVNEKSTRLMLPVLLLFALGAVAVDALPLLGADFGGAIALASAFAVLVLKLTRKTVKPLLAGFIVLLSFALALLIAYFDWLRPPQQRTHLGNFIDSLPRGELGEIIWRKLTQIWTAWDPLPIIIASIGFLLVMSLIAFPLVANWRNPYRRDYAWLLGDEGAKRFPQGLALTRWERALIAGWATAMIVGSLFNDTSVVVAITGLGVAGPAALAHASHRFLSFSA